MADETVYLIKKSTLDNIADAINDKTGASVKISPNEMISEINSLPNLNDLTAIIEKDNLIKFENNTATQIGNALLMYVDTLTTAKSTSVEKIKTQVFSHDYALSSVNFPNCKRINDNGFLDCFSYKNINFPNLLSIGNSVFQFDMESPAGYIKEERKISLPKIKYIGKNSFRENIIDVSDDLVIIPEIIGIDNSAFEGCYFYFGYDNERTLQINSQYLGSYAFANTSYSSEHTSISLYMDLYFPHLIQISNGLNCNTTGPIPIVTPTDDNGVGCFLNCRFDHISCPNLLKVPSRTFEGARFVGIYCPKATFEDESLKGSMLGSLTMGTLNKIIGKLWDANATIDNQNSILPTGLNSISAKLGNSAYNIFRNCTNIEYLNLDTEDGVLRIPCYGMTKLKSITGLEKIYQIETSSFMNCSSLLNISIGSSDINGLLLKGSSTFDNCSSLNKIEFKNSGTITLCSSAFANIKDGAEIHLPNCENIVTSGASRIFNRNVKICCSETNVDAITNALSEYSSYLTFEVIY